MATSVTRTRPILRHSALPLLLFHATEKGEFAAHLKSTCVLKPKVLRALNSTLKDDKNSELYLKIKFVRRSR
jgi:hypothetical protein